MSGHEGVVAPPPGLSAEGLRHRLWGKQGGIDLPRHLVSLGIYIWRGWDSCFVEKV